MPPPDAAVRPAAADLPLAVRIGQVNQRLRGWEALDWTDDGPRVTDLLKREVDRWGGLGALYGVLRADPWSGRRWDNGIPPERSAEAYAAVQDHVTTFGDGLPVLFVEEMPHGLMALGGTTLPVNLALGAAMDPALTEELAAAVAAEARARGSHVALLSGLDLLRDPRWGRAEECYSEDPELAALLMAATVRGLQGSAPGLPIDDQHVAVVAKHLAGQGAGIGGRNGSGAPIGRRELGEIHLPPAHAAATAGVAGFMAAYNDIDGIPCTANRDLLTATLRENWGWEGIVMADGGAVDRLLDTVPDRAAAAAAALGSGVDLSLWDESFTEIADAIDRGLLSESTLDGAVERVLALKERLGLFTSAPIPPDPTPSREIVALAARAARQSVVLLRDSGVLPLAPDLSVAVVGPNADDLDSQLGDYTPPQPPDDPQASTVLSALRQRQRSVHHARGSALRHPLGEQALAEVGAACAEAEVCVVVLGGTSRRRYSDEPDGTGFADNGALDGPAHDTTNGEGVDLSSVALPACQLEVARVARASGRPVIAVLIDGRPRAMAGLDDIADAVVLAPFGGPGSGAAIAEVLGTGLAQGRLPATLPAVDATFPLAHDERLEYAHYRDAEPAAVLPFGSADLPGMSFHLASPDLEFEVAGLPDVLSVPVLVGNSGPLDRDLPVLVFGRGHQPGIRPRRRRLLGLARASVPAGAEIEVEVPIRREALSVWADQAPVPTAMRWQLWAQPALDPPADPVTLTVL